MVSFLLYFFFFFFFFFEQKTAYDIGLGIPAEPLFRSQRIFLMSSLMLLLVWLIFFMVLIKLLPILGTISGKTVKLMVLALLQRIFLMSSLMLLLVWLKIGRASCRERVLVVMVGVIASK